MRLDIQSVSGQDIARLCVQLVPVDRSIFDRFLAQEYIFTHRHVGYQRQFLVHDGDAFLARLANCAGAQVQLIAIVDNAAFIGSKRVNARQNFHQCRFAGAVFATKAMNFATTNLDRHVVQGGNAGEAFGYIAEV